MRERIIENAIKIVAIFCLCFDGFGHFYNECCIRVERASNVGILSNNILWQIV